MEFDLLSEWRAYSQTQKEYLFKPEVPQKHPD